MRYTKDTSKYTTLEREMALRFYIQIRNRVIGEVAYKLKGVFTLQAIADMFGHGNRERVFQLREDYRKFIEQSGGENK